MKRAARPTLAAMKEELGLRLEAGDLEGTATYLLAQTEAVRQKLKDFAWEASVRFAFIREDREAAKRRRHAANLAVWATLEWEAPHMLAHHLFWDLARPEYVDRVCDILTRRWPPDSPVRDRVVAMIHATSHCWALSHRLEADRIGPAPTDNARAIRSIIGAAREGLASSVPLATWLRENVGAHASVWRWFGLREVVDELARHDRIARKEEMVPWIEPYRHVHAHDEPWDAALVAVAAELPEFRHRLIDGVLNGLSLELGDGATWLCGLHERVQPAFTEIEARRDGYVRLLSASHSRAQDLARTEVTALWRAGRVGADELQPALSAAATSKNKRHVLGLLRLLARPPKNAPAGARAAGARAACEALKHESIQVQTAALEVIEAHGDRSDPQLVDRIRDELPYVAASNRARLRTWLEGAEGPATPDAAAGEPPPPAEEDDELLVRSRGLPERWRELAGVAALEELVASGASEVPRLEFDPLAIPRLTKALEPITDFAELVEHCLVAIEDRKGADDLERIVDGIARLSPLRPPDFEQRAAPLRHRTMERLKDMGGGWAARPFVGQTSLADLLGLVVVWLHASGERPTEWDGQMRLQATEVPKQLEASATVFLSCRLLALAQRVSRGVAFPLLSTPTHAGGFIDPRVLVARAQANGPDTDVYDRILALLRIAPEHRAEALSQAGGVPGELGSALRYALGGDEAVGPTGSLWYAAARTRAPLADDAAVESRHPDGGPDAGRAALYAIDVAGFASGNRGLIRSALFENPPGPIVLEPPLPADLPHDRLPTACHRKPPRMFFGAGPWATSLWPLCALPTLAREAHLAALYLDSQGLYWRGDWEPLFDPDAPLGLPGALLVSLGVGARHPSLSKLAEDALLAAIDDSRLDGPLLGAAMTPLLQWGQVTLARWVRALRTVADASPLHVQVLRTATERAVGDAAPPPRSSLPLLETLHEWVVASGGLVDYAPARAWLGTITGSGKAASLAAALLARRNDEGAAHRRAAARRALEQRVSRAERWASLAR
jgi:hypothetical protein